MDTILCFCFAKLFPILTAMVWPGWPDLKYENDLFVFDPELRRWTNLSGALDINSPPKRAYFGFTAIGSKIYRHGGSDTGVQI